MDIVWFGPDDVALLDQHCEVVNAVRAADSPWEPTRTRHEAQGEFRHGWDGEPGLPLLGLVDGVPVAAGEYSASNYDNLHLAWADFAVHPDHRRRGHGSELLATLSQRAVADGRRCLGVNSWDLDAPRAFAAGHGFEERAVAVNRRQHLADVDWARVRAQYVEALPRAASYVLERRAERTPDAELTAMAELTAAINDAPTDALDIEDEVYTPERIRAYETAQAAKGQRVYRVLARHRESGQLTGQSVVTVEAERPELGFQHDTSVVAAHRGHRLGLLLKAEMALWLNEVEPQLATIDTWNAESNDHMISVNELLGYRVMGRALEFQKDL